MTLLESLIQSCINAYQGNYGKVKLFLDDFKLFTTGPIKWREVGVDSVPWQSVEWDMGMLDDVLIIAFRGSDGKGDWRANFRFRKKREISLFPEKKCKAHNGFLDQYIMVRDEIHEETLKRIEKYNLLKIIITGHSLGGALATLCAFDLKQFGDKFGEVQCVTFGSPRVGNRHFVRLFSEMVPGSLRFVYGSDVVTKVPPVIFFYRHVEKLIKLKKDLLQYVLSPIFSILGNPLDHYPEFYKIEIENLSDEEHDGFVRVLAYRKN